MVKWLKQKLYFVVASYFRFFARIQLAHWKPRIVVITGSSGKTTLLHMVEAQLGERAVYSHHANSVYGIPFHILGLERRKLVPSEWVGLFLAAPFKAFKSSPLARIYVAEVDAERPGEGKFLADLLKPEVSVWLNTGRTHTLHFDPVVPRQFSTIEEAVANEFGFIIQHTQKMGIVNGDQPLIQAQLFRSQATIKKIHHQELVQYQLTQQGTRLAIQDQEFHFPYLLPQDTLYAIRITQELVKYLGASFDPSFQRLVMPPGRSSVLKGIKDTTLIDSSYNATPDGMAAILHLFAKYPVPKKWLVLGDMIELGKKEETEHQALAHSILTAQPTRVILIGPRVSRFTYPLLKNIAPDIPVTTFEFPADGLRYIQQQLQGGETLLFKGARFLEGVIEHLLKNQDDVQRLCRREYIWQKRRKEWGL